jgi:hypothetical protein
VNVLVRLRRLIHTNKLMLAKVTRRWYFEEKVGETANKHGDCNKHPKEHLMSH